MLSASEQLSLSVTNKMLELQDQETPLTLNAILSTCLLYQDSTEMLLSDLLKKSETVYEYLKQKPRIKTYMTFKPHKTLVKKHLQALGFPTKANMKDEVISLRSRD